MDAGAILGLASLVGVFALTIAMFFGAFREKDNGDGGGVVKYYKKENEELREQNKTLEAEKDTLKAEKETFLLEIDGLKRRIADLENENAALRSRVEFLFEQVTGKKSPQKNSPAASRRAVLFVSTSPVPGAILNTGVEARAVEDALRKTGFEFRAIQATRPHDITRAILDFRPTILHFAGHGEGGEIYLEDEAQKPKPVSVDAIARLLKPMPVTGVVLNACYSAKNLAPLMGVSEWAVGMKRAVQDPSAIGFSDGFYMALAEGKNVQAAFDVGVANAGMQSAGQMDIPILEMRR
jgi:cell division protein FtsB